MAAALTMRISLAEALAAEGLAREPSRVEVPAYALGAPDAEEPVVSLDMPRKIELSPQSMPKKVELPAAALAWSPCEAYVPEPCPSPLSRSPQSPPPALPPVLPLAVALPEPQTPPPSTLSAMLGGSPLAAMAAVCPPPFSPAPLPVPLPTSLPPALPPSLPTSLAGGAAESQPPSSPPSLPAEGPRNPGSKLHATGRCRPCAWFWKPGGCQNGAECAHCHLCPEGEIKARKKARQTMARLGLASPDTPGKEEASRALRLLSRQGSEQESTTGASSEQEWTVGSASEHESAGDSDKEEAGKSAPDAALPPGLDDLAAGSSRTSLELPPGLGLPSGIPSLGSVLHSTGDCQPCAWFWKKAGCSNGAKCGFCHLCPEGSAKVKKKTTTVRRPSKA